MLLVLLAFTLPAFLAALGVTQAAVHHHASEQSSAGRGFTPTSNISSTWSGHSALDVDSFKSAEPFACLLAVPDQDLSRDLK